jgi:hypothetical protein
MADTNDNPNAQFDKNAPGENAPPIATPAKQEQLPAPKRLIGSMKGMFTLPENFEEIDNQLDKEIEELFLGSEIEPQPEDQGGSPAES